MSDIAQRKADHLDLAVHGDVGFKKTTTLFECVRLVHDALPELDYSSVELGVRVFDKPLRAPILIAGMTGGTERAARVNRELAALAQERGYAFGLGSQRAMLKNPDSISSYQVRDVAPDALVLGNIGAVQASEMSSDEVGRMLDAIGADALCVHLNPGMELIQADGDRDFSGCLDTLSRLTSELSVPVVAKETGCGLSGQVGKRLRAAGIRHVDVSGAGGTSWVAVETQRASAERRAVGETFWDWGIPTAASLLLVRRHEFETVFATGGLKSGLDLAKALALGATAGGVARPALQALENGGPEGAQAFFEALETELRTAMLLCGARDVRALRSVPRVMHGELRDWIEQAHEL